MSGPQAKPFKGRLGFDANGDKVVNLADPTNLQDGVNLRYFIANNTVQTFDPARSYPAGFVVETSDRLYKSKAVIPAGASFDPNAWTEIHAFGRWLRVTSAYTAEPGDNLFVSTQTAALTITLPFPAEDGDIVTILDEGYAKNNAITVSGGTNTINNLAGSYSINSQDICAFIYLGGTWRVSREEKSVYQSLSANTTVAPNTYNIVDTSNTRTITLPVAPITGQWVTVADGSNNAATNNITVSGNGKLIAASASYTIRRYAEQVTFVYDGTIWVPMTNALQRRIPVTLVPVASQTVAVALDGTAKSMTLPTSVTGDWVEVVTTAQDTIAAGSLVVTASASTYFRNNGLTQNTTTYRIKRRGKTLFILQGSEWSVIHLENGQTAAANLTIGNMVKNTLLTLTGSASNTISLPASDSIQIGDFVTCQLNTSVGRVLVSVQNTGTDLLDAGTTATYLAVDNGVVVTFIYRGWNGTKYVWETINHGSAFLQKTQNLADLPDKAVSRTNLDVFSKGESDARFLPLHAKADTAAQADNADKLDGLHGVDFIQVKNPSVTAVDANTTTETRFTTNVNTPDATLWQVVMFVDNATGDKAQIAMNSATSQMAYRSYASSWSAWSRLDALANAATATKLATPRAINGVNFDGTAAITVLANPTITDIAASTDMNTLQTPGEYTCALTATALTLTNSPSVVSFSLKVLRHAGVTQVIREYDSVPSRSKSWFRSLYNSTWGSWYQIYDAANPQPSVTGNAGTATKWATPRTLTLTGSASGSASIDGSGDVSMNVTVTASGVGDVPISQVTGLQSALDGKLASGAKAADSELLDGFDGADYKRAIASTNSGEDPNTTTSGLILTNHANTPDAGVSYWFIDTQFYQTRTTTSGRFQYASQFNGGTTVHFRKWASGSWSAWVAIAAIIDGNTYNINVSGNAATASTATKLTTPRNINGVPFDGTANITVADATKLPLAGGIMTGPIKRSAASYRFYDNVVSLTTDTATVNGTLAIKLPVNLNNTMMNFSVTIFNYVTGQTVTKLDIGGYNYSAGWQNLNVSSNDTTLATIGDTVRFATDGTNAYVLVGTTATVWGYPKVTVNNLILGFTGASDVLWDNPWTISYLTSETGMSGIGTAQISPYIAKLERTNVFTAPQTINTGANGTYLRNINNNNGVMFYQDASAWYLMKTAAGDPNGTYDATRPFYITLSTGAVTLGTNVTFNGASVSMAGTLAVTGILTTTAQATMNGGLISAGWLRTTGATGWYSQDFGGGWMMQDTTWIRAYGSKGVLVSNDICSTGNVVAYYSDRRLKENLKVIEGALDIVKSWTGYRYNANPTAVAYGYDASKSEIGLIAQEVQATTPEAVEQAPFDVSDVKGKSKSGKNYLTLKYERLVPVLVQAIKEQDVQIQELKEQVALLMEAMKK
jgi:hypothetical protein